MSTNKELMAELDKLGIKYPMRANKSVLEALFPQDDDEEEPEKLIPDDDEESASTVEEDSGKSPDVPVEEDDYLRKYQCKKLTIGGKTYFGIGGRKTDPDVGSKAERMKAHLLEQPRVMIMVPVGSGESAKTPLSVTLNGYRLDLPRNTYVEVPQQVAETVRKSLQQQIEALEPMRADRDERKEGSSVAEALS